MLNKTHKDDTVPIVIELPVLDDEGVEALQEFLWNLVMTFESQYYHQLQRYRRRSDAPTRDPIEPQDGPDEDLNDEVPF